MEVQLTGSAPEVEAPEQDAPYLTLSAPAQGVTLRLSAQPLTSSNLNLSASSARNEGAGLLAVSNTFGWVVAGTNQGFSLFSLPSLLLTFGSTPAHTTPTIPPTLQIPTSAPVDHLKFAMSEKVVVAALRDGTVGVWRLKSLVEGNPSPLHIFPAISSTLAILAPCPAPSSPLLFALSVSHTLHVYNLESLTCSSPFPALPAPPTALAWSVKGKQITLGTQGGGISQWSPEGQQKSAEVPLPPSLVEMGGQWEVRALEWLENTVWLVFYGRPSSPAEEPNHEEEVFVLSKQASGEVEYTRFMDPTPAFGMMSKAPRRWVGRFRNWSPYSHLLFLASSPSTDVGVLSQSNSPLSQVSPSEAHGWSSLSLPDTSRPSLPLTEEGGDVCPLSLELVLSGEAGAEAKPEVWVYTSEGVLVSWRVGNEMPSGGNGEEKYEGMRKGGWLDVRTQEDLADSASTAAASVPAQGDAMAITPAPTPAPSQPNPFATSNSPFGAPSSSPFAVPSSSNNSSTGAGAFGAPAFGAKPAFGASPFGASPFGGSSASPSVTPAFGSSPFGGGASSTAPAAGGFAAFGATSPSTTAGAGAGGGGFAGFGAASASPFGAAAAPKPAEGGSIFGSGTKFAASPAFGAATSSPASTPAAPATSAFGGGSAFGGAGKTTSAFGGSSFGAAVPAFGQSAFGSTVTPSTTTASTTPTTSTSAAALAPAFGSISTPAFGTSPFATKPALPSASTASTATATSAPAFGSSPFASSTTPPTSKPATSTPAFGQSPFGAHSTPAFGSSPFGTPSATTSPAAGSGGFAGFGSAAVAAATSSSPAAGGFGAFSKPKAFSAAPAGASPFAPSTGGASPFASAAGGTSPFASAGAGKSIFGGSTTTPKTAIPSAFGTGGSAFGSGGSGSAFGAGGVSTSSPSSTPSKPSAFASRPSADSDDEEEEEEEDDGKKVRADEPPDLEPTKEGLDLMQSMREAKGSLEKREEQAEKKDVSSTSTSGSAFGLGGLGFGTSPAAASPATSQPLGTSIFGSATPTSVKTPPAGGFGAFGSALKPSTGFSFGSAPAQKKEIQKEKQKEEQKEEQKDEQKEEPSEEADKAGAVKEEAKDDEKKSTSPPSSPAPMDKPTKPSPTTPLAGTTTPSSSTKSLFGFASSPPQTPSSAHGSLLGRVEQAEADEEGAEDDYDEEDGEEYDEEDGEHYDEDEYDEEGEGEGDHNEEVHYEGESEEEDHGDEDQQEEHDTTDDKESTSTPSAAPSLLSRLSPAPPSPSPSPSPSPTPAPATTAAPAFSFATTAAPAAKSPFSFAPTPSPSTTPAAKTDNAGSSPFSGFSGFPTSSAATIPAVKAPTFSFASASTAPAAEAPKPAFSGFGAIPAVTQETDSKDKTDEAQKSLFGGFGAPAATKEKDEVKEDTAAKVKNEDPAAKPATSFGFGGFASTPSATPTTSAPAPASFFNLKSTAPKSSSPLSAAPTSSFLAPSATTAPPIKSPLGFGFGSAPPQPTSSPSPFALAPPVTAAVKTPLPLSAPQSSAPSSMSSMLGGFQTKPAAPAPAPSAAFPSPTPSPFGAYPSSTTSLAPAPTPAATLKPVPAQPPSTPQRSGPSLSSASTPKLGSALVKGEMPRVQETGMAGEFLKAYMRVEKDFEILRENSTIIKSFVKDIGQAYQPNEGEHPVNYDDKYWSLGDLGRLKAETKKIAPSVRELVEKAQQQKRQAAELQSLMLKAETKREETARFIRARSDPAFANMVRVRQLGPEQVENQKKIRLAMEAVRTRVEQVEDHVVALKDKTKEERLGRSSFKAPSLDTINRSIRNVTAAAHEKALELDSLAGRLDLLRLQPSSHAYSTRHRSPSAPTAEDSLSSSVFRASPNVKYNSVVVKPDAVDTAKRALEAERRLAGLKSSLLSVRKTSLFNQAAEESTSNARTTNDIVDLNLAFTRGAITAGRLPRPRRPQPLPAVAPSPVNPTTPFSSSKPTPLSFSSPAFSAVATPSAPAPSWSLPAPAPLSAAEGTPPPLTFKAPISFSFAPSTTTSSPPVTAGTGSSRARGGSSRAHSAAVQLRSGGGSPSAPAVDPAAFWSTPSAASTPPPKPVQGFQSLNFGAPAPATTPSSFSGFGAKQEEEDLEDEQNFDGESDGEEAGDWSDGGSEEEGLDTIAEE